MDNLVYYVQQLLLYNHHLHKLHNFCIYKYMHINMLLQYILPNYYHQKTL